MMKKNEEIPVSPHTQKFRNTKLGRAFRGIMRWHNEERKNKEKEASNDRP